METLLFFACYLWQYQYLPFDTALGGRHTQMKERRIYRKYYFIFTKFFTGALPLEIDLIGIMFRPEYRNGEKNETKPISV